MASADTDGLDAGLGIYVHSPFCRRRCAYCDFAIAILHSAQDVERFLDGIALELARHATRFEPRTLYIGGGTPTRLAPADLERFFELLHRSIATSRLEEWTVEANPEDVTDDRVAILRSAGVTRVSLGAQSLDDDVLRRLGRRHRSEHVEIAVHRLRDAGIASLNVDLIHAVPGQSLDSLRHVLQRLARLPVDHVSAYSLTYEDRTPLRSLVELGRIERQPIDDELLAFRLVASELASAGFQDYEVSNFAKPGHVCAHNLGYWRQRETLGIGPSAVSYRARVRSRNEPDFTRWHARLASGRSPVVETESLSPARCLGESFAVGLRLTEGVDLRDLERHAGTSIDAARLDRLEQWRRSGFLERSGDRVRLTTRGREIADAIAAEMI